NPGWFRGVGAPLACVVHRSPHIQSESTNVCSGVARPRHAGESAGVLDAWMPAWADIDDRSIGRSGAGAAGSSSLHRSPTITGESRIDSGPGSRTVRDGHGQIRRGSM